MLLIYEFTLNCNWQPVLLFQTWGKIVVQAFKLWKWVLNVRLLALQLT